MLKNKQFGKYAVAGVIAAQSGGAVDYLLRPVSAGAPEEAGQNYKAYLTRVRMKRAMELVIEGTVVMLEEKTCGTRVYGDHFLSISQWYRCASCAASCTR